MKKFLIFVCFVLAFSTKAIGKETTYSKELFDKALSEEKVVVVSSWIKYCTSCASQMKVLEKAKNDFDNMEYFAFDVTNKEIAQFFNIQYQTKQPSASLSFLSVILATSYSLSSVDDSPPSIRLSSSRSKWICRAVPV